MSFQSRDFRHFLKAGVTLGVDVCDGEAKVAVSFTNRREKGYSRAAGRSHMHLQFDADDSTLQSLGLSRNVFKFPYDGQSPRRDVLAPISQALKDELEKRVKSHRFAGSVSEMKKIISRHAIERRSASKAAKMTDSPCT